jgi:hypothetical protein
MEDTLIVEKENEVFHVRSKKHRFSPQTCAAAYNALLRQLVAHGMPQDEFGKVRAPLQKTGRAVHTISGLGLGGRHSLCAELCAVFWSSSVYLDIPGFLPGV